MRDVCSCVCSFCASLLLLSMYHDRLVVVLVLYHLSVEMGLCCFHSSRMNQGLGSQKMK